MKPFSTQCTICSRKIRLITTLGKAEEYFKNGVRGGGDGLVCPNCARALGVSDNMTAKRMFAEGWHRVLCDRSMADRNRRSITAMYKDSEGNFYYEG